MRKTILTFTVISSFSLLALVSLVAMYFMQPSDPRPRLLDPIPLAYVVQSNSPKDTVSIAFHVDSSGDVFYPKEFGLDLYVQNGDKGFKQTVDSCKDRASLNENTRYEDMGKSFICDKKIYTVKLEDGKVVFYRSTANSDKEFVTSMPVLLSAKNLVFVDSYKLYSNEANKTLSILESF